MGDRGVFGGGQTVGSVRSDVLDYVTISTTGNATDFGDLTVARSSLGGTSNGKNDRGVFAGGTTDFYSKIIDYITISTTGNATSFGNLRDVDILKTGTSNGEGERGLFNRTEYIDYITISTTGNATSFGNLSVSRTPNVTSASSGTNDRGVFAGGWSTSISNVIDYVSISTTGNAIDFGDLTVARNSLGGTSNGTNERGVFAGGASFLDVIDYITISTIGNATDFGDLNVAHIEGGSCSNARNERGLFGGGRSASSTVTSLIQYITISTTGNSTDFGDRTEERYNINACSNAETFIIGIATHWQGGVSIDSMRYMYTFDRRDTDPTITDLQSGGMELPVFAPVYNTGVFGRHTNNRYDYINISTTGNASLFGNMVTTNVIMTSSFSNGYNQRGILSGSGSTSQSEYITINSAGNATYFGDLSEDRTDPAGASNGPNDRGLAGGGTLVTVGTVMDTIDYVTISTTGNSTDFGDLTVARRRLGGCSNEINERCVFLGGRLSGSGRSNTLDYVTISTIGNATDFGDLLSASYSGPGSSNGTNERGVLSGGYSGSYSNVIQYITINSAGNATDFGDLTVSRGYQGSVDNKTNERSCTAGGYSTAAINIIDYITINSTGNATDFGDLVTVSTFISGLSNS